MPTENWFDSCLILGMHPSLRHRPQDFIDRAEERRTLRLGWGLSCALALLLVWGTEPSQAQSPGRGNTSAQAEASRTRDFQSRILFEAEQWVKAADPQAVVDFAPLNNRGLPRDCAGAIAFDRPFASRPDQIRARCQSPEWGLFIQNKSAPGRVGLAPDAAKSVPSIPPSHLVLVTKANLSANQPLDASQLELQEVPLGGPLKTYFTTADGLEYSTVVRAIEAGKPLRATDLRPSVLVKRGQPVTLAVQRVQGLTINVKMQALQDGRFGDQIKLINMESGKTTTGLVSGWAQVSMP